MSGKYWDLSWNPLIVDMINPFSYHGEGKDPIIGGYHCTKISPGCRACWAEGYNRRFGNNLPYDGRWVEYRIDDKKLLMPLGIHPPKGITPPKTIFVCDLCDIFHNAVRTELIDEILEVISSCSKDRFLILTKRPELMEEKLYGITPGVPIRALGGGDYIANIGLGITLCNQQEADEKARLIHSIPSGFKWFSLEPLLGPIKFSRQHEYCPTHDFPSGFCHGPCPDRKLVDWIVLGGETGPGSRPMDPEWVRSVRDLCRAADISFFFKSWGDWVPDFQYERDENALAEVSKIEFAATGRGNQKRRAALAKIHTWPNGIKSWKIKAKYSGRLLDGREWNETPWDKPAGDSNGR
jgi:protein gp37